VRAAIGYGGADAGVGAAATDVARHGGVDIVGGGLPAAGQRLEESNGAHDLTALAVAALRHVMLDPGCMHGGTDAVGAIGRRFDRGELLALGIGDGRDAGADGLAIQMHRAGAALGGAAAELRACQPDDIAQRPKHRHRGIGIDHDLSVIHN
jgi:hypothetical protein